MKKLLLLITLIGIHGAPSCSMAASADFSPFKMTVERKLRTLESASTTQGSAVSALQALPAAQSYTADGISNVRIARATYDVATDGGGIGSHALGVSLPAKALIRQAWFYTNTQFVDAGSGTVALQCEDAGNIYAAADVTGITATTVTAGIPTGVASTMVKGIAANCELTAVVAGAAQTDGKLTLFVEYVVTD